MRSIFLILVVLLISFAAKAQVATYSLNDMGIFPSSEKGANVKIIGDQRIKSVVNAHIQGNSGRGGIKGYRVQIYFGSGTNARENANGVKLEFLTKYPGHQAYLEYNQPYFKVLVGNFRNKLEASKFKKEIEKNFPNTFIVEETIDFPKL